MTQLQPRRELPDWWQPLLGQVAGVDRRQFTRLATPTQGGREAAVLILLGGADAHVAAGEAAAQVTGGETAATGTAAQVTGGGADAGHGVDLDADVLLLQRAADMRNHAGQPAFPGGAIDPGDDGPVGAALREAAEEVGLDPTSVDVQATLPRLWIPVSQFVVTPVLAWWRQPHPVRPRQPAEVARVERVPVVELVDPANRLWVRHPSGFVGPAFQVRDMLVWGFTAGVLSGLLDLAGWTRPWRSGAASVELPVDVDRTVP